MPFRIALSGLNAAQTDLSATANNIANASTAGFKRSRTEFSDVFAVSFEGLSKVATGNGVGISAVSQNFSQGNIDFTDRSLDIAISGQGFLIVNDAQGQSYTRAGAFHVDRDGNVVNQNAQKLQVFEALTGGGFNTGNLQDLVLSTTAGAPKETDAVSVNINLSSSEPVLVPAFAVGNPASFNNSTSTVVYDSLGTAHTSTLYYKKTAANSWDSYLYIDGTVVNNEGTAPPTAVATPLIFAADGSLGAAPPGGLVTYDSYTPTTGASTIDIVMDYNNTTQFGSGFAVNGLSQNGFSTGRLSGIDIDDEGVVFARFTNGQSNSLGKVALANFSNVGGLRQLGDTVWAESFEAGDRLLGEAGTSSFGFLQSGGLESSNVDIAASLVNLITAQRNFQANAQVISAADTVTQTIINI